MDFGQALIGDECFVAGYPSGFFSNTLYNYPFTNNIDDAMLNLENIFKNSTGLICSPGQVKWSGQIIEIACSTCKGMSGSPILQNNSIIGVFVGGPTLFGQRELFLAARYLTSNDVASFWMHFYNFTRYQDLYDLFNIRIMHLFYTCLFESIGIELPQDEDIKLQTITWLIDQISSLVIKLKDKNDISHNSALPTNGIAFQELMNDAQRFRETFKGITQINISPLLSQL